jgi:hypothetical protein
VGEHNSKGSNLGDFSALNVLLLTPIEHERRRERNFPTDDEYLSLCCGRLQSLPGTKWRSVLSAYSDGFILHSDSGHSFAIHSGYCLRTELQFTLCVVKCFSFYYCSAWN